MIASKTSKIYPRSYHLFLLGLLLLFTGTAVMAQAPNANPPPHAGTRSGMSSVATGTTHAAVLDAQHRPITAGGFVKSGPIVFEDIAKKAGLTVWTHTMGSPAKPVILDAIGSGVALLDYDNDGWLDIYMVNGSTVEALTGTATPPHAALFHNNHDGTFTDVAEKAGVALGGWSTGATWGDYDGDGRLDLFVPGYVHMDVTDLQRQESETSSPCSFREIQVMCGPRGLKGEPDHLFHNNGDGTFTDVSSKAGVADAPGYYGLSSLFVDINGDGRLDILVADDSTPNYLYVNNGNGTFKDDSFSSGYALNENGNETASMGIAIGDYTHNGRLDIYNTVFSDDYNPLYRNDGDGNFTDIAYQAGIAEPTIPFLGWGTAFFDYDNDGWLDLFMVNGHVYPQVDQHHFGTTWAQRPLLFHNVHGTLRLVPAVEGSGLAELRSSRGMAYGDLFNDGKIDVVVNNIDSIPSLFRNVTGTPAAIAAEPAGTPPPVPNHWIGFKLIGGPKSPRDAIGATIYLTAEGFRQRADVLAGGSFASSHDQRPHFGLGATTKVDAIEIRWPDGTRQQLAPPAAVDTFYTVTEGQPAKRVQRVR